MLKLRGSYVCFGQQDRVPFAPGQEIAELAEKLIPALRRTIWSYLFYNKRRSVDSESGYTEFKPEADDPDDFFADGGGGDVEIGLVLVEPVIVPRLRAKIVSPNAELDPGKYDAFRAVFGFAG